MHEVVAFLKIVLYSLLMVSILVVMTLSLLSIVNDDMEFGEGSVSIRKGRIFNILMKLGFCGIVWVGYVIMMIQIR